MVGDRVRLLGARSLYRFSLPRVLRVWSTCYSREFDNDTEDLLFKAQVPEALVNKRLTAHELSYSNACDHSLFSANQVSVNRPVEDRWSAYRFGLEQNTFPSVSPVFDSGTDERFDFGGTLFTVVDGHGGHACAHTINLLHCDYMLSGLLPAEISEQVLNGLRNIEESSVPHSVSGLVEMLWSTPEALPTGESEYVGSPRDPSGNFSQVEAQVPRWATWGPWGPLPTSVRIVHLRHFRKVLEESLSCSFEGNESYFEDNDRGDVCDPEGFLVAPLQSIQEAIAANHPDCHVPDQNIPPPGYRTSVFSPHLTTTSDSAIQPLDSEVVRLHDRVACISHALRNSLRRLDLDLSLAAQPGRRDSTLDKALLRTVFSGCVATSAFIPSSGRELYVTQVGDCGAVVGSFAGLSDAENVCRDPTEYNPLEWQAELLVAPHNSENEAEVRRLRRSHPIHEAPYVLRDERLLGELMPLRAFGDIRFKWPIDELKHVARLLDLPPNYPITPSFYATPPYLYSAPQIVWRPLIPHRDYFLILGTDGLWDVISPKDAVNVVARHWFDYACNPSVCGPGDTAASRLIRTALGGEEMDTQRISAHFSLPATVARYYRDDITVIVVYLPTAFQHKRSITDPNQSDK